MKQHKVSVLISSCDKYEDVWMPFFHFFKKHWPCCSYPIYLNTESKEYTDPELCVNALHAPGGKLVWSARLKHALKRIDTDYILFMLEDFFSS